MTRSASPSLDALARVKALELLQRPSGRRDVPPACARRAGKRGLRRAALALALSQDGGRADETALTSFGMFIILCVFTRR